MTDITGQQTRPSLLLRVRDPRDAKAWVEFAGLYTPLIYGHARRRGLSHEDGEDVTQRVFARVSEAIRSFEYQKDRGRFRDWLGFVVRNEVFRHLKKNENQIHGQGGDDQAIDVTSVDPDWSEEYHTHLLQTALARSRPHFEDATWQAFERVWLNECPAPEVARTLGRTIDWVYVAKSRVMKRLWQEVQELGEDAPLLA